MNQIGNKRLIINLSANIVSYSTNILIAFVLTPYLINTLGKETYSFYPIANNFVAYMCILTNALNSMSSRFVMVSYVKGHMEDVKKFISSVLFSNMIMAMLLLIPMVFIIIFIDKIMDVPINIIASVRILFAFVFSSLLINILSSVFGVATFVKNRIDLRSIMQLAAGILKILMFYILFKYFTPTIIYVGIVAFAIALFDSIFQQYYFKKLMPNIKISALDFSIKHIKKIFSSGSWNSINAIGSLLLTSSSLIMANIIFGAAAGGVYSIVNTVPIFINGVISMLVGVFAPTVTYSYALGDKNILLHNMQKAQAIIGMFSCSVLVVFVCLSQDFFSLWVPKEDSYLLFILSTITILPHFFIGCLWPITNLNIAANKVARPAIFQLILGILNILIVITLSHFFNTGIITICIVSTILSLLYVLVFLPIYAAHYLQLPYTTFYKVVIRMLCSTILLFIFLWQIKEYTVLNSWFKLLEMGAFMGIVSIVINFIFIFDQKMKKNTASLLLAKLSKRHYK